MRPPTQRDSDTTHTHTRTRSRILMHRQTDRQRWWAHCRHRRAKKQSERKRGGKGARDHEERNGETRVGTEVSEAHWRYSLLSLALSLSLFDPSARSLFLTLARSLFLSIELADSHALSFTLHLPIPAFLSLSLSHCPTPFHLFFALTPTTFANVFPPSRHVKFRHPESVGISLLHSQDCVWLVTLT